MTEENGLVGVGYGRPNHRSVLREALRGGVHKALGDSKTLQIR